MVRNINSNYGDSIEFNTVEELGEAIQQCGYDLPDDGLVEGRDYEIVCTKSQTTPCSLCGLPSGQHADNAKWVLCAECVDTDEARERGYTHDHN